MRERSLIERQLHATRLGQGLPGQIVGRGAKAAGHHDHIGPGGRLLKREPADLHLIAHGGMLADLDTHLAQLAAQPHAVRIDALTAGQLIAYRHDFGTQGWHRTIRLRLGLRRPEPPKRGVRNGRNKTQ